MAPSGVRGVLIPVVGEARVSARAAARIAGGHPWVYRGDVEAMPAEPGVVRVRDARGRALGMALASAAPAPVALRVYARGGEEVAFDEALVRARLARAIASRRELYGEAGARSCRLVHAEADALPGLFVDRWGDAAVVQSATAAMDGVEAWLAGELAARLGVRLVVARDDGSARDHEGLPRKKGVLAGDGPAVVRVREGEATLELDLLEDAKTGGFHDQRENHARAGELARGEALDAFSYHGGFALQMARRAERVLALEEDPRAAARARRNAELSGLANLRVEVADAFAALRELERAGRAFDVVVVDPPALGKRKAGVDAALRAYHELNLRALRLTRAGGWLLSCSCSGRVGRDAFETMLAGAARDARREVTIVERRGAGRDHPELLGVPETGYLKCWVMRVA